MAEESCPDFSCVTLSKSLTTLGLRILNFKQIIPTPCDLREGTSQEHLNSLAHMDTQLDSPVIMFTALGQDLASCQEKPCLKERPKCVTGRRGHTIGEGQRICNLPCKAPPRALPAPVSTQALLPLSAQLSPGRLRPQPAQKTQGTRLPAPPPNFP